MTAYSPKYTDSTSIYLKSGLSSTEKDVTSNDSQLIQEAEYELEMLTGRKFTSSTTITEYLNGPNKDIIGYGGYQATSIRTSNYPILSITSFGLLDTDGAVTQAFGTLTTTQISAGTFTTSDYWLETQYDPLSEVEVCNGFIRLKTATIPPGTSNVKITYTYGYGSVPVQVKNLASTLGAIRQWVSFLGGSYNRLDSYSIPQQNVSKGDFYVRGTTMINVLQAEADRLLDRIGRRPRVLFGATGASR